MFLLLLVLLLLLLLLLLSLSFAVVATAAAVFVLFLGPSVQWDSDRNLARWLSTVSVLYGDDGDMCWTGCLLSVLWESE